MAGGGHHAPAQGAGHSATGALDAMKPWFKKGMWLFVAIAVIATILWFLGVGRSDTNKEKKVQQAHSASTSITTSRTTTRTEVLEAGVVCDPIGVEKHTCIFNDKPTMGFGSAAKNMQFCFDKQFGVNESYRWQYWNPSVKDFVDVGPDGLPHDQNVSASRFVGNMGKETVAVTYWGMPHDKDCDGNPIENTKS